MECEKKSANGFNKKEKMYWKTDKLVTKMNSLSTIRWRIGQFEKEAEMQMSAIQEIKEKMKEIYGELL